MRLNSSGLSIISQCPTPVIFFTGICGNCMCSDIGPSMSAATIATFGP